MYIISPYMHESVRTYINHEDFFNTIESVHTLIMKTSLILWSPYTLIIKTSLILFTSAVEFTYIVACSSAISPYKNRT